MRELNPERDLLRTHDDRPTQYHGPDHTALPYLLNPDRPNTRRNRTV